MPKREERPLKKHTVLLYEDAVHRLAVLHGRIGASRVIRLLVDKHLKRVDEMIAQGRDPRDPTRTLDIE